MSAATKNTQTGSTSTFVTALVVGLLVFGAEMALYVWFHTRHKKIYQPRTFLAPEGKRAPELPNNPIQWFMTIIRTDTMDILKTNGLDAYGLVRQLLMFVKIFVVFWLLTWIVLMPVTAVQPTAGQTGFAMFTFGNVAATQQARYGAHLAVAWVLTFWVFYLIWTECKNFVKVKHDYLSSPEYAFSERARTVLVTGVPKELMDKDKFTEFATVRQDCVDRVWLVRDVEEANDVFDERQDECTKLEGAEGKLLALASKRIRKGKATAPKVGNSHDPEQGDHGIINSVVPAKKRPTRRLGKIPFIGEKKDTIEYSTEQIRILNGKLEDLRKKDDFDFATSVLVRFKTVADALDFAQNLEKSKRKQLAKMSNRYFDVAPDNICWDNLDKNSKVIPGLKAISWGLTIALILFWIPITAFIGAVANLSNLCSSVPFLSWLCQLPSPVVGIIQGALPPLALAIALLLVPIIFKQLATFEGQPLNTEIDKQTFKRYFLFLIIHGFLIVTVSGALTSSLSDVIQNPSSAPQLLAQQLPLSSTFFTTYIVTTGLATSGKFLSQAITVAIYSVKRLLGGVTPRKIFQIEYTMPSMPYFKLVPNMTLLMVLGIVYSCIQPVITLLALVVMGLYYIAFIYLYRWVFEQPPSLETGGAYFPMVITHVFVALYIEEICLIGLFFLASDASGGRSAIPEGVLMIVLLIATIAFQLYLKRSMKMKTVQAEKMNQNIHLDPANRERHGDLADESTMNAIDARLPGQTDDNMFDQPALWQPQPPIWIADDVYSLARIEVAKIKAAGVEASTEGTSMDEKSKVYVHAAPPNDPRAEYLNKLIEKEK